MHVTYLSFYSNFFYLDELAIEEDFRLMQEAAEECEDSYGVFQEAMDALEEEVNDLSELSDDEGEDSSDDENDVLFDSAVQPGSVAESQVDALILKLRVGPDGKKSQERRNLEQGWLWFHPQDATSNLPMEKYPSPSGFYKSSIFIWAPHLSHPGISVKCPYHDCNRACGPQGWASNPKARRVLGLDKCYYLASYQYQCPDGHGKFYASHPGCIRKMPLYIQYQFPAILTKKLAIDLKVMFVQLIYIHDLFHIHPIIHLGCWTSSIINWQWTHRLCEDGHGNSCKRVYDSKPPILQLVAGRTEA